MDSPDFTVTSEHVFFFFLVFLTLKLGWRRGVVVSGVRQ